MLIKFVYIMPYEQRTRYFVLTGHAAPVERSYLVDPRMWTVEEREMLVRYVKLADLKMIPVWDREIIPLFIRYHVPMGDTVEFYSYDPLNASGVSEVIRDLLRQFDEFIASGEGKELSEKKKWWHF